ncbi:hypothetical protein TNCV_958001 [Trichonephila clavipes]|nr:hypothetical protein TNCV_958001 [Trichonephila clavipes]
MLDIRTIENALHSSKRKYWTFEQEEIMDIQTTGNIGHSNCIKFHTFEQHMQDMLNIHITEKFPDISTTTKSPDILSTGNAVHLISRKCWTFE